ncbi:MAG: HD domain-containing protein [Clostridia bacterium]|nr:HD domain-containing protein [Clostridia bacterium]
MDPVLLRQKQKDEAIDGILLIKDAEVRVSSTGSKYLDATVTDATGEMNAKCWDWGDQNPPASNLPIRVRGLIKEFAGKLQLRIDKWRPATAEEVVWSQLIPTAPEEPDAMYNEIHETIVSLTDEDYRDIALYLLEGNKDRLMIWPAATSFHHAQRSGLLYHTVSMLRTSKALLDVYQDLNRSLLLCGVVLHDLSKLEEISSTNQGVPGEYTPRGMLLGHISMGMEMVRLAGLATRIPEEKILLLQHMLLSHHELPEFGSPRPPMIPEAEVLQAVDRLDARLFAMREALKTTEPGTFSDRVRSMDGRRLYKPLPDLMASQVTMEETTEEDREEPATPPPGIA